MAKKIQVSDDAGANWHTLPGNTGELRTEMAVVNDTIFGQSYESNQPSLGQWNVSANGIFKGVAGYSAVLRKGGTPVAMTSEAAALVSGKTYQITAPTKRIIDYATAVTVQDGATNRTNEVESIDYLNGLITFKSTYTVTGAVTVTGSYVPTASIAKARSFTLTQNANEIDDTDYETARTNNGLRTFDPGLRTVQFEIGGIYALSNGYKAALFARDIFYLDVTPDNSTTTMFRAFTKLQNQSQSGDVGALEEENVTLGLWVPDGSLVLKPFSWYFGAGTKMNAAIQKVLTAWQNETPIQVRYLPDGTAGDGGTAIVTECSLANQLDGQNEFRFNFRGSGALTAV